MDILNWINWIKNRRYLTKDVPSTGLIPVAIKDEKRDDRYLTVAVPLSSIGDALKPYKVYTALLTQTGIDAPVATVLENTLLGTPTWSFLLDGQYLLTLPNGFIGNVLVYVMNGVNNTETLPFVYESQKSNSDSLFLNVKRSDIGALVNGGLTNASIEIRVYD